MNANVESLRHRFFERLAACTVAIDGMCNGAENMRRDASHAATLLDTPDDNRIYIRLYAWQPWCISLGNTQAETDIDIDRAHADGIDVVRRPTGGRAILHARELTYALILRLGEGLTHGHVYRFWHEWLATVLRTHFGTDGIVYSRTQPDFPQLQRQEPTRWLCFASSARFELLWRGRKLVGSAQRLYGTVLLQHGSLLLGTGHERLPYYLRACSNPDTVAAYLSSRSATLEDVCGRSISFDELSGAITSGIHRHGYCAR
ncbi:MAG: lipoate--protein ligase family protein [Chlorobi bacterium]|nr:lipoate--protein ligase family protein [Chlorobiota bacterium]